ncbi:hypothetical protein [Streptomyces sp. NPDC057748]|uniref:hypothetical protein n=1 Tax=unclassified Streptomyces TaxID=2593676 RepID=UPI00367A8591
MPLRQFAWHNGERLGRLSIRDDALLLHAMKWPAEVRSPDELAPMKKADVDEDELAWETHDVATACNLPVVGPAPCLNMVLATRDGHVLHQFPCTAVPRAGLRSPRTGGRPPHRSPAVNWCRRSRPR